ncbi:MAG: divalent-cation tolerance protein CutA [Pelodictyon phaeoclathratiforme]|uniref:CutA1 divalent ion tolerance protein n=1 Tax=Pelodictyon phaeoclathratiforme (strain DSM 5477 / BU-1) TaxID=324925 RepID=B4SE15_PELPB|nr:CutA1 divalent ion tolerance protein [Pelodictyon phaeoclathratiforme BU-1]MBV5289714.1 divalent-cation tolerance protein CutA [Pelodictyon phaeoclathratiforme]
MQPPCSAWAKSLLNYDGVIKISGESEVLLSIKTTEARYSKLEAYIEEYHPYDVPEIIKLPITGGLPGYLNWLDSTTGKP